ncbi:MAG: SRPBCC domain-containing protein [Candidatus Thorarchaeota archaeon]
MTSNLIELNTSNDDELIIVREFAVSKSLLFKALTDHDHIKKWSSPQNFDVTFSKGELKVGGTYSYGMQSGDDPENVMSGEYKEIVQPDKLVYTQSQKGSSGPETEISITLEEQDGKTTMMFRHTGFPSKDFRDGAIHGWNDAFEKLDSHLTSQTQRSVKTSTKDGNVETVRNFVKILEKRRFDEFVELFAEDAKWIHPYSSGLFPAETVGQNEILRAIQKAASNFEEIRFPIEEIIPLENPNRVIMRHTGKLTLLNGKGLYENDYLAIFTFDERGKITEWMEYYNPIIAAKAFGLMDKIR